MMSQALSEASQQDPAEGSGEQSSSLISSHFFHPQARHSHPTKGQDPSPGTQAYICNSSDG